MGVDNLQQIQILNQLFSEKESRLSEKLLSLKDEVVSLVGSLESQKTAFKTVQAELTTKKEREQELENQVEHISIELKTQTNLAEKRLFRLEERERELLLQLDSVKNETQKYLLLLTEKEKEFLKKEYSLRDLLNQMDINHHENSKNHLLALVEREKEFRIELKKVLDEKHVLAENFSHKLEKVLEEKHNVESQLRNELANHQQMLIDVVTELENLKRSFTYRLTAPLRAICEIFIRSKATMGIRKLPLSSFENVIPSLLQPIQEISMPSITPIVAATSLDELLAYYDTDFVHCAYLTLIGRVPDPEGMRYYLTRIRAGRSKIAIIHQLTLSIEAKNHNANVIGLKRVLRQYKWKKIPILGVFIGSISDEDSILQKMNQMENSMHLLGREMNTRFDAIEQQISVMNEINDVQNPSNELETLSPSAQEIYCQLQSALKQNMLGKK